MLFRISYINNAGQLAHKGNFATLKEAREWIESQKDIIPLKLLIWDKDIQCFRPIRDLSKFKEKAKNDISRS